MPSSDTSGQTEYNPSQSGTKKTGFSWNISYGDGSGASGDVYADTVEIGGVTATQQAVEGKISFMQTFAIAQQD